MTHCDSLPSPILSQWRYHLSQTSLLIFHDPATMLTIALARDGYD